MSLWTPHTGEDRMLYAYWQTVGAHLYTEVPIASPRGDDAGAVVWKTTNCSPR